MNIRRLLPEKTGCQAVFFVESFLKKQKALHLLACSKTINCGTNKNGGQFL
jgi:hypothetical protein